MKLRSALAALVLLVVLPVYGELSNRYIARGFESRDAMLSAFFALSSDEQGTAIVQAMRMTRDCGWSEPWVLIYRPNSDASSSAKYEVFTLSAFDQWTSDLLVSRFHGRARAFETGDPQRPVAVVRYIGNFCSAQP